MGYVYFQENIILSLDSVYRKYKRQNIIVSLASVYRNYKRINTQIILSGNIYKTIPITFNVLEQLFLPCEVRFIPSIDYDYLPFSKAGG